VSNLLALSEPHLRQASTHLTMAVSSVVVLNDFCHVQGGASRGAIHEAVASGQPDWMTFLGAVGPIEPDLSASGVRTICLQQPQLLDTNRHPKILRRRHGIAMPTEPHSRWKRSTESRPSFTCTATPRR
jgi:hypothetical protein